MSRHFVFQAIRAVVSPDGCARYELLLDHDGQDTCVGPLREYAARSALACLGFTSVDIDRWIERAPLTDSAASVLAAAAPSA